MSGGVRAAVAFPGAEACPVAALVAEAEGTVVSTSTSVAADGADSVTAFLVRGDPPAEAPGVERSVSEGTTHLLRRRHGVGSECPCERLGAVGCPVERYAVEGGRLVLWFSAADYEGLRRAVGALGDRWPAVQLRRVVPSPPEGPAETVLIDRSSLTERQLEVLETAHRMGYFERPRGANATEVAAALDIDPSTFSEHLSAALDKLLADALDPQVA